MKLLIAFNKNLGNNILWEIHEDPLHLVIHVQNYLPPCVWSLFLFSS